MDEFLDDFSSSPWPDMSTNVRASWAGSTPGHTNGLLADPIGVFEGGGKNSTISMIPSRQVIECLGKHTHNGNSTILVSGNSNYIHDKELFLSQTPPVQEAPDHMLASSQHVNGSHESEFSLQSMIESNSSVGLHSISSIPSIWPSTYANVPSFAVGPQTALTRSTGLQTHQQLSQSIEANSMKHCANQSSISQLQPAAATGGGSNGAVRPRVRARRGQATDPHSIAERLRREKIAERMRNLQELVPNSNKTDKASMLDEIIDYVKFLQLQVKVLSMSRMGAAGAVVPLITDVQSEASGGLLLSASVGQGVDPSDSQETIVFEKEVMKLMESSVTTAMQYLQNKGMCLMPIALATAISGGKNSTNNTMTHGITSLSSNSSTPGLHASSSCSESFTKESTAKNESREDAATSGCNGSTGFKQEQTSFFTSEV